MQPLNKPRRPVPVGLPSLRAETTGSPAAAGGWGSKPAASPAAAPAEPEPKEEQPPKEEPRTTRTWGKPAHETPAKPHTDSNFPELGVETPKSAGLRNHKKMNE